MSKRNSTICKLCKKALAHDEASVHHCEAWCGDGEDNVELQNEDTKE